jgi:hypothetical protein
LHEEPQARFNVPPIVDQTQRRDASHRQPSSNEQSTGNPGNDTCDGNTKSTCPGRHLGMAATPVGNIDKAHRSTVCRYEKTNAERHQASTYRPNE